MSVITSAVKTAFLPVRAASFAAGATVAAPVGAAAGAIVKKNGGSTDEAIGAAFLITAGSGVMAQLPAERAANLIARAVG